MATADIGARVALISATIQVASSSCFSSRFIACLLRWPAEIFSFLSSDKGGLGFLFPERHVRFTAADMSSLCGG
jgi:hypothetical protein